MKIFLLVQILFLSFLMSGLVSFIAFVLSFKSLWSFNNLSPFECGFNPWANSRQTFSIQFFLLALIFLIFDVELILLYPMVTQLLKFSDYLPFFIFFVFIFFLTTGFIFEWVSAQLDWYL